MIVSKQFTKLSARVKIVGICFVATRNSNIANKMTGMYDPNTEQIGITINIHDFSHIYQLPITQQLPINTK